MPLTIRRPSTPPPTSRTSDLFFRPRTKRSDLTRHYFQPSDGFLGFASVVFYVLYESKTLFRDVFPTALQTRNRWTRTTRLFSYRNIRPKNVYKSYKWCSDMYYAFAWNSDVCLPTFRTTRVKTLVVAVFFQKPAIVFFRCPFTSKKI